ncbi:MAG: hypothetical protein IPJ86_03755 [Bacteroidetes bacterium]|jgi:hypothetical protein|nr:hypothetical protein [Bacteroidota bacterium]MBK9318248.1 hypothetical protein [Bacteroidota bacterium]
MTISKASSTTTVNIKHCFNYKIIYENKGTESHSRYLILTFILNNNY